MHVMPVNLREYLREELGLKARLHFLSFGRFYLALVAGVLVLLAIHTWVLPPYHWVVWLGWDVWLAMLLWQPIIEELLFRGVIQGELRRRPWGKREWLGITEANLITSLLFVAMHFINHPPFWALAVFFPSLVFGYFRDRCDSVIPAIALHILYNFGYFVAVAF